MISIYLARQRRKLQSPLIIFVVCFVLSCCYFVQQQSSTSYDGVNALHIWTEVRLQQPRQNNRVFPSKSSSAMIWWWLSERRNKYYLTRSHAAKPKDDEDDNDATQQQPGMVDAFRQLESLKSLDDPEEYIPAPDKINVNAALADTASTILSSIAETSSTTISPEQDFAVYRNMLEEIEEEEGAASYTEVLDELGGSALQTDDTYSQIMTELGGTKVVKPSSSSFSSWTTNKKSAPDDEVVEVYRKRSDGSDIQLSNERLLDDALKEALNEVQLNNPQQQLFNERSSSSILNDKEMMQEIESIFERGNAQLIESLEEIRREQVRFLFCCTNQIVDGF